MVVRLVVSNEAEKIIAPQFWLVFFGEAPRTWWSPLLKRGFGHVAAAAYIARQDRWVIFDPMKRGLVLQIFSHSEVEPRLGELACHATLVLRVAAEPGPARNPAWFWCVGAIKSLLGVKSRALSPWRLSRHLLARGAEIIPVPGRDDHCVDVHGHTGDSAGRPVGQSPA